MVMPVMFITAQRQLWSENLRVAEGNPFTGLPQGFPVGCLIQDIDSYHSSGPRITYWFTLLTVVSWKLNHSNLHCHIKYTVVQHKMPAFLLCQYSRICSCHRHGKSIHVILAEFCPQIVELYLIFYIMTFCIAEWLFYSIYSNALKIMYDQNAIKSLENG